MLLRARHVIPVDGPPIRNGAVLVRGGGIAEVGTVKGMRGEPDVDFGEAAILPGLVNAHTHLELTGFAGQVPPAVGFVEWIRRLSLLSGEWAEHPEAFGEAAREGMRQSLACGVTTVGDITKHGDQVRPVLRVGPLGVVSFGEVIATGTRRGLLAERLRMAVNQVHDSEYLRTAVSPHAPYSVDPEGIRACMAEAERLGLRVSMHLAESPDEETFTRSAEGPLRGFLEGIGIWDDEVKSQGVAPLELVHQCGVLGPQTLLAHCNYLSADEIGLLARTGTHVAYCPRSHAAFGHERHPFREMLRAGVNVCIGTDSLASNPSLSVLDELRYLRGAHPELDGALLLEMGTVRGARALGLDDCVGSLTVGKRADLTVVPLDPRGPSNPVENVLHSTTQPVATFVRGHAIGNKSPSPRSSDCGFDRATR